VCCGKGICSMLASYLFQDDSRISKIIMMDKASDLDWSHIAIANQLASVDIRPVIETHQGNLFEMDEMIEWLSTETTPLAIVGIHLCRNLSPTLVGITNVLGPTKVPFLCLAPCCLPRIVIKGQRQQHPLEIAQFEPPLQRQARLLAAQRRRKAQQRRTPCLLCQSTDHKVNQCRLLPASESEQLDIFQRAAALEPCWKCGELGHLKKDCPSTQQTSSVPALIPRPVARHDVSHIIQNDNPFATYCDLLSTTIIARETVHVVETGLKSTESSLHEHGTNWNRERKTVFIVATTTIMNGL
jgi:hypothetical protein